MNQDNKERVKLVIEARCIGLAPEMPNSSEVVKELLEEDLGPGKSPAPSTTRPRTT